MSKGVFDGMVSVSVDNGTVVLGGYGADFSVNLIGSSCVTGAIPGNKRLSTVSFAPNKGEEAVVALCVNYGTYRKGDTLTYLRSFLRLYWDGNKLIADLSQYICPSDRMGQITAEDDLIVATKGQRFSSLPNGLYESHRQERKQELLKQGVRIVDDANLLCRYLVGQATFEELEAVASGDMRTAEQIQLANKQAEMVGLQGKYSELQEKYRHLLGRDSTQAEENDLFRMQLEEAKQEQDKLQNDIKGLKSRLDRTLGARVRSFWKKVQSCLTSLKKIEFNLGDPMGGY
jgi:hypothetical protein